MLEQRSLYWLTQSHQGICGSTRRWLAHQLNQRMKAICRPAQGQALTDAILDLSRSKTDLIAENALLRHQLGLLKQSSKRLITKTADRLSLLLVTKVTRTWRRVLLLVQPATLLRRDHRSNSSNG